MVQLRWWFHLKHVYNYTYKKAQIWILSFFMCCYILK
jgi:hypothetical protein